jgi:hypothetical protein
LPATHSTMLPKPSRSHGSPSHDSSFYGNTSVASPPSNTLTRGIPFANPTTYGVTSLPMNGQPQNKLDGHVDSLGASPLDSNLSSREVKPAPYQTVGAQLSSSPMRRQNSGQNAWETAIGGLQNPAHSYGLVEPAKAWHRNPTSKSSRYSTEYWNPYPSVYPSAGFTPR